MDDLKVRAINLYTACMNCANTEAECPGILKNITEGIPPRGFRFDAAPVKLLIVAKNPGHLLGGERDRYRGLTGTALFAAYREFQRFYYADPDSIHERSNRFHKNLFRYLRYFLDLPGNAPPEAIYRYAAHTNLVKCSTPNEQARIRSKVKRECFRKYFTAVQNRTDP